MGRSLASGECSQVRTALSGSQVEETLPQFPGSQRPGLPHDPLLLFQDVAALLCLSQPSLLPLFPGGPAPFTSLSLHVPGGLGKEKPWVPGQGQGLWLHRAMPALPSFTGTLMVLAQCS